MDHGLRSYKIITLCGSARFEDAFKRHNERLTLEGHAVFSLAVYPSDKSGKDWYNDGQKLVLDMVHKRKIDASDEVFVVDCEIADPPGASYVGLSTASEIEHAIRTGKTVRYASRDSW